MPRISTNESAESCVTCGYCAPGPKRTVILVRAWAKGVAGVFVGRGVLVGRGVFVGVCVCVGVLVGGRGVSETRGVRMAVGVSEAASATIALAVAVASSSTESPLPDNNKPTTTITPIISATPTNTGIREPPVRAVRCSVGVSTVGASSSTVLFAPRRWAANCAIVRSISTLCSSRAACNWAIVPCAALRNWVGTLLAALPPTSSTSASANSPAD